MNIKQLTTKQRRYIEKVLLLIRQQVGNLDNISLTLDEYSCIEFPDGETAEVEVQILKQLLMDGEYNDITADYLNGRKDSFKRMLDGNEFTFNIHPIINR